MSYLKYKIINNYKMGIWGLGPIPNPQSPIPILKDIIIHFIRINFIFNNYYLIIIIYQLCIE